MADLIYLLKALYFFRRPPWRQDYLWWWSRNRWYILWARWDLPVLAILNISDTQRFYGFDSDGSADGDSNQQNKQIKIRNTLTSDQKYCDATNRTNRKHSKRENKELKVMWFVCARDWKGLIAVSNMQYHQIVQSHSQKTFSLSASYQWISFASLALLFTGDRHQQTNSSLLSTFTLLIYHRVYKQISICFWDQNAMSIKWTCSHRFVNVTEHDHRPQIFWFFSRFHRVLKNEIESDKHQMTSNPL